MKKILLLSFVFSVFLYGEVSLKERVSFSDLVITEKNKSMEKNSSLDIEKLLNTFDKDFLNPKVPFDVSKISKNTSIKELRKLSSDFQVWYLNEMVKSENEFPYIMTNFWHNILTTELRKIKNPILLQNQHLLIRKEALGNYKDMVISVVKDDAMLKYLDAFPKKDGIKNENLARELLELFTLGDGNYTENDIQVLADGIFHYSTLKLLENSKTPNSKVAKEKKSEIEEKSKTRVKFLDENIRNDLDSMLQVIFSKKEVADYIAKKVYNEFISRSDNKSEIDRLRKVFYSSNYDIKSLMSETLQILKNKEKLDPLYKSPLELYLGAVKGLGINVKSDTLNRALIKSGYELFNPPDVKGYRGGEDWIREDLIIAREEVLKKLLGSKKNEISKKILESSFQLK